MQTTTHVKIRGFLVGAIWWPVGAECWKDLDYDLTREDARIVDGSTGKVGADLRYHILRACNDGDFQSAVIAHGEVEIERRRGSRRTVRTFPLSMFPSVADCVHDDPDWCPQCLEDFDD